MMLRIGICHYKVGGTDGVSLEMEKWALALRELGHVVYFCGGDLGSENGCLIEGLYHHRADVERITENAFRKLRDYRDGVALEREIYALADRIETELRRFIEDNSIELLIPNNIWSIGFNLPAAIAFTRVVRDLRIPAIGHHHDFYWESFRGMRPTCREVNRMAEEYLPPRDPLIKHVVINSIVRDELEKRSGVIASIVPNVFDFSGPPWQIDAYNRDFRRAIGLTEGDILILQATRIVARKGIELAIDLVAELNRPDYRRQLEKKELYDGRRFDASNKIVLVLAGYSEDSQSDYLERLQSKATRLGVELRIISDLVRAHRCIDGDRKLYSLWDCYVFADLITYPSLHEGWGNQFLEALRAKVPVVVFEYPVYRSDIKRKGFTVISLGNVITGRDELGLVKVDKSVIARAASEAITALTDRTVRQKTVEHNFALGKSAYDLNSLERYFSELIKGLERRNE